MYIEKTVFLSDFTVLNLSCFHLKTSPFSGNKWYLMLRQYSLQSCLILFSEEIFSVWYRNYDRQDWLWMTAKCLITQCIFYFFYFWIRKRCILPFFFFFFFPSLIFSPPSFLLSPLCIRNLCHDHLFSFGRVADLSQYWMLVSI